MCALIPWQTANQLQLGDNWGDPSPKQDEEIQRVNHLQNKNMICPSDAPACVAVTPPAYPPGIHLQFIFSFQPLIHTCFQFVTSTEGNFSV